MDIFLIKIEKHQIKDVNVFLRGTIDYLNKLNDAEYPLPLFVLTSNSLGLMNMTNPV